MRRPTQRKCSFSRKRLDFGAEIPFSSPVVLIINELRFKYCSESIRTAHSALGEAAFLTLVDKNDATRCSWLGIQEMKSGIQGTREDADEEL